VIDAVVEFFGIVWEAFKIKLGTNQVKEAAADSFGHMTCLEGGTFCGDVDDRARRFACGAP